MKVHIKKKVLLLATVLCLVLGMGMVPVSAAVNNSQTVKKTAPASVKKGLVQEGGKYYYYKNGKRIKNSWKNIGKNRYYFGSKGDACTFRIKLGKKVYLFRPNGTLIRPSKASFVTRGKNRYYVSKKGVASTGWFLVKKNLYHADSLGRLRRNKTYDGIKFDKYGKAKSSTATKLKKKTMSIVSSITNSKMSKSQKLRACWNYVACSGRFGYWPKYPNINKKGWQKSTALDMLNSRSGNCYSFACAFAALAKEVGYSPKIVCGRVSGSRDGAADGMTRHCWVKIKGLHYDPEAQYAGWYRGVYGNSGYGVTHSIQKIVDF